MDELDHQIQALKLKRDQVLARWDETGNKALNGFLVQVLPMALNAEVCSIFVHDDKRDKVWLDCSTNLPERYIEVPRRGSIVGDVITTGQYVIKSGLDEADGVHRKVDSKTGFVTRNALCVPITSRTRQPVIGAIQMLNKHEGEFSEEDRLLLEQLTVILRENMELRFLSQDMVRISEELDKKVHRMEKLKVVVQGGS